MVGDDANVTAASRQRDGRVTSSRRVQASSLAFKLIVLCAVMVAAYLAFSVGPWGRSPTSVAAAEPEDRPSGTGVKDAIQDLYAEIKAAESDGPGSWAERLDVATSVKAQYVSDSLRRMVGNGGAGGGGDERARRDGHDGRDDDHAGRTADGSAPDKDRRRADSRPRHGETRPPLSREDVNELVQRFFDGLDHFDRLKSSSPATTRRRSGRGVSATKSTPGLGIFNLAMFNRHRGTSSARGR